jgi:hypothetical protein
MPNDDGTATMSRRLRPRAARTTAAVAVAALLLGLAGVAAPALGPAPALVPAARAADPTPAPTDGEPWWHLGPAGEVRIDLWFGYSTTCPHCAAAEPWLEDLAATYDWLDVHPLQVNGDTPEIQANREQLVAIADSIGEELSAVPIFLFGEQLDVGFGTPETTGVAIEAEIVAYHDEIVALVTGATPSPGVSPSPSPTASADPSPDASPAPTASPGPTSSPGASPPPEVPLDLPIIGEIDAASLSPALLAVVLGGLDAFNPCALSVLLFLMSILVGTRSRKRMALVGGVFVFVSGLVYFLLMAAWLNVFLLFGELRVVTLVAGGLAVVAATINIKDFVAFRRGVSLVMPDAAKPQVFGRMFDIVDAATLPALLGTTILVAAVANTYEMLCTGGFPVVFTRVLTLNELPTIAYYGYLVLYNLVYVTPMLLIVAIFTATLGSHTVTQTEARRLKLLSGLLMLGLGLLLLFAPERLTDMTATLAVFGLAVAVWAILVGVDIWLARRAARGSGPP